MRGCLDNIVNSIMNFIRFVIKWTLILFGLVIGLAVLSLVADSTLRSRNNVLPTLAPTQVAQAAFVEVVPTVLEEVSTNVAQEVTPTMRLSPTAIEVTLETRSLAQIAISTRSVS